jgi:hypothetical protein
MPPLFSAAVVCSLLPLFSAAEEQNHRLKYDDEKASQGQHAQLVVC